MLIVIGCEYLCDKIILSLASACNWETCTNSFLTSGSVSSIENRTMSDFCLSIDSVSSSCFVFFWLSLPFFYGIGTFVKRSDLTCHLKLPLVGSSVELFFTFWHTDGILWRWQRLSGRIVCWFSLKSGSNPMISAPTWTLDGNCIGDDICFCFCWRRLRPTNHVPCTRWS